MERALAVACEAARAAGRIQVEHYERLERVEHKGARDVVTEVDRSCEALILAEIRAAFPRDAILAEESGAHRGVPDGVERATFALESDPPGIELEKGAPVRQQVARAGTRGAPGPTAGVSGPTAGVSDPAAGVTVAGASPGLADPSGAARSEAPTGTADPTGGARRTWIVDPLDGTINYANGIPVFCVCIGLAVAGDIVLGVVYDPMRDELFTAVRGHGANLNGRAIAIPDKPQLSDYVVSLGMPARGNAQRRRRLGRAIRAVRNLGSAGLSLTYVANGRFDAFIQVGGLSNWDIAGPGLVAQEAGATVTGVAGEAWFDVSRASRTIGIVAGPPRHHAALLEYLR